MKSTKGKSLLFTIAIWVGYISGITHKLLYSRDAVLYIYIFNLTMVTLDLILYFVNRRYDKQRANEMHANTNCSGAPLSAEEG